MTENKKQHGGSRAGAGRPKIFVDSPEQIASELVFPALCSAFKQPAGKFKERILTVDISKVQIRQAYGYKGLCVWQRYFKEQRLGGMNRRGEGYPTRWVLHFGSYEVAKLLVESLGHTIKDLPNPGFPPAMLLQRLRELDERREQRRLKKEAAEAKKAARLAKKAKVA